MQEPLPDMEQTQENSGGSESEGPEKGNSRRKSKVWNHFCLSKDGTTATCNYCQQPFTTNGTSHLWRHYRSSHEENGDPPQKRPRQSSPVRPASNQGEPSVLLLEASDNGNLPGESSSPTRPALSSSFNQEECVAKLAEIIAFHGYPSSIVDNECFTSFVRGLNPGFQMPTRASIEATCRQRAKEARNQLRETLARCSGNISLALGTAETDQGKVMYMACQFIDEEWTLQKRIMETFKVVPFPPYHHGALLGMKEVSIDEPGQATLEEIKFPRRMWASSLVEKTAHGWGLSGRLISVARGQELNATTYFLGALGLHLRFGEYPIRSVHYVTYSSDVMSSAADKIFSMLYPYFVDACFEAVKRLNLDLEKRARYCSELGLNNVRRYDKRWYSFYCALEMLHKEFTDKNAVLEEPPVPDSRIEPTNSEVDKRRRQIGQLEKLRRLRRFKENQLTELLRNILGVTYRSIQRISSSRCCTSNLCIEEVMKLREVLQSEATDAQGVTKAAAYAKVGGFTDGEYVHTVLLDARSVLDNFLEHSFLYLTIPAILDPRFKLCYVMDVLEKVFGTKAPDYIFKVYRRIKGIFTSYFWNLCDDEGTSSMATGVPDWSITEVERQLTDASVSKVFKEIYETEDPSYITVRENIGGIVKQHRMKRWVNDKATELERYLTDEGIPLEEWEGFDVLNWWKENSHRYPTVARMARDALAMPSSDLLSLEDLALIRSMTSSYGAVYPEKPSDNNDSEFESDDDE